MCPQNQWRECGGRTKHKATPSPGSVRAATFPWLGKSREGLQKQASLSCFLPVLGQIREGKERDVALSSFLGEESLRRLNYSTLGKIAWKGGQLTRDKLENWLNCSAAPDTTPKELNGPSSFTDPAYPQAGSLRKGASGHTSARMPLLEVIHYSTRALKQSSGVKAQTHKQRHCKMGYVREWTRGNKSTP